MNHSDVNAGYLQPVVTEQGTFRWLSATGAQQPKHVVDTDGRMSARDAYRLMSRGTGLLWRGDFHNARQFLSAVSRRHQQAPRRSSGISAFHQYRKEQAHRARTLARLLVRLEPGHVVPLRRAPDVRSACLDVYGPVADACVLPLRELLGVVGAKEWRRKGVFVPALGETIYPHYGVFAPTRNEYVDLVAESPLPDAELAFDIGAGTGVLAAVLARRGVAHVVATDNSARAIQCAEDNVRRLGLADRVEPVQADLFPGGRADLIVCNPPWLPAKPHSPLDHAVYDEDSRMLLGFLDGVATHLRPGGEAWLILSDLAERLGLRTRAELLTAISEAGLRVVARSDTRPRHPRAVDSADPLHAARAAEVTSLWRLGPA